MKLFNSTRNTWVLTSLVAMIAAGPLASCSKKEGCTDPASTNYDPDAEKDDGSCVYASSGPQTIEIAGTTYYVVSNQITSNTTLNAARKWYISGGVFVQSGATLTIEPCTEIFAADDNTTPFLAIQQGGKIMAEGQANCPIVFSTIKKVTGGAAPGDWGGIIVNGRAQINICNGNPADCNAQGEGQTGIYGGTNDNDDSGVMKYIRVEYGGKILGTDNELNGFSFNAVGSQTVLEHLQAYRGADDGFEFFGGKANLKWAVSSGNTDDSFDWTHGWRGKGQFWVVQQSAGVGDRCIEADNWETNYTVQPYSDPMIANFTILANGTGTSDAVRLRHGTRGDLYNGLVAGTGVANGIRVSDTSATWMDQGLLVCKNTTAYNFGTNWKDCATFSNDATNSNTDPGVLNGYVGTDANNAIDPGTLDSWFTPAVFKGAVENGDDWTQGWTLAL